MTKATTRPEADYLWGLKGNQSGILERAQARLPRAFFSAEYDTGWRKEHGRLARWRPQRVSVSPEEAGLCGGWQFISQVSKRVNEVSKLRLDVHSQPEPRTEPAIP